MNLPTERGLISSKCFYKIVLGLKRAWSSLSVLRAVSYMKLYWWYTCLPFGLVTIIKLVVKFLSFSFEDIIKLFTLESFPLCSSCCAPILALQVDKIPILSPMLWPLIGIDCFLMWKEVASNLTFWVLFEIYLSYNDCNISKNFIGQICCSGTILSHCNFVLFILVSTKLLAIAIDFLGFFPLFFWVALGLVWFKGYGLVLQGF